MPISIDSSGGAALDYSVKNVNKVDATTNTQIPQEEKQQSNNTQPQVRQELPKEEVEAIFFNRQDSQLTRDILNTYASNQESTNEISFTNIDAYEKILKNSEPELNRELVRNSEPNLEPKLERAPSPEFEEVAIPEFSVDKSPEFEEELRPGLQEDVRTQAQQEVRREFEEDIRPEPVPQRGARQDNESDVIEQNS